MMYRQKSTRSCAERAPIVRFIGLLVQQIILHQRLQQLVPVHLADEGAGVVVVGDIGGILGQDVTHDLVDGVVTLFLSHDMVCALSAGHY